MAESESGQDKTEDPTEKRKKDSREKGEIARSKELNTVATMMAGAGALLIYGGGLALDLAAELQLLRGGFASLGALLAAAPATPTRTPQALHRPTADTVS